MQRQIIINIQQFLNGILFTLSIIFCFQFTNGAIHIVCDTRKRLWGNIL